MEATEDCAGSVQRLSALVQIAKRQQTEDAHCIVGSYSAAVRAQERSKKETDLALLELSKMLEAQRSPLSAPKIEAVQALSQILKKTDQTLALKLLSIEDSLLNQLLEVGKLESECKTLLQQRLVREEVAEAEKLRLRRTLDVLRSVTGIMWTPDNGMGLGGCYRGSHSNEVKPIVISVGSKPGHEISRLSPEQIQHLWDFLDEEAGDGPPSEQLT
eukprot:RCo040689